MERTREVLEFAIQQEIESYELYTKWATETDDDELCALLEELALEEEKHRGLLRTILKMKMLLVAPKEHPKSQLPSFAKEEPRMPPTTVRDMLVYAIRDEQETFELYRRLAAQAPSRKINGAFLALAEEELGHKQRLEQAYDKRFSA